MDAQAILDALLSRGAMFEVKPGGRLCVEVPDPDELEDVDIALIRQHKAALIELLSRPGPIWYVDRNGQVTRDATAADLIADRGPEPVDSAPDDHLMGAHEVISDTDRDYDLNERAAIQEEGCNLTVKVSAYDLLQSLKARNARVTVHPGGADVEGVELSDVDAGLVREHNTMLSRWILQRMIRKQTGIKVEIAQWAGFMLPEPDWYAGFRPESAYEVTFSELVAPTPELLGLWALVMDHPPRLYRTPWRAAHGFLRTFKRHQATVRRYRRFGKLKPPDGLAVAG
jgi:hypothetical protein